MENNMTLSSTPVEDNALRREVPVRNKNVLQVALSAIMTALVAVTTFYFQIPIAATGGYFNFGEVMIYTTAVLFGPYVGAIAGGVGAAISDLASGFYAVYAPATLIIKSLEGLIIGFIYQKMKKNNNLTYNIFIKIVAIIPGGLIMVAGYFIYQTFILNIGFEFAIVEVPLNLLQFATGMIAALIMTIPLEKQLQLEALAGYVQQISHKDIETESNYAHT